MEVVGIRRNELKVNVLGLETLIVAKFEDLWGSLLYFDLVIKMVD